MKTYPHQWEDWNLGKWGRVRFKQWLFPNGQHASITEEWVDKVAEVVAPGSFVIDIGAFTGDTSIPFALATGPTGRVLAFEPGSASYEFLAANCKENLLYWVDLVPMAVTVEPGAHTFYYTDEGLINGGNSDCLDIKHAGCGNPIPHQVQGVSLSEFVLSYYQQWLDRLSFVKIDTEGYDCAILKTNAGFFRKYRPIIQVEVYPFLSDRERADLANTIHSLGYSWTGSDGDILDPSPQPKDLICRPK